MYMTISDGLSLSTYILQIFNVHVPTYVLHATNKKKCNATDLPDFYRFHRKATKPLQPLLAYSCLQISAIMFQIIIKSKRFN